MGGGSTTCYTQPNRDNDITFQLLHTTNNDLQIHSAVYAIKSRTQYPPHCRVIRRI